MGFKTSREAWLGSAQGAPSPSCPPHEPPLHLTALKTFSPKFSPTAALGSVAVTSTGLLVVNGINPVGAQDPQSPNPFSQLGMSLFSHGMTIPGISSMAGAVVSD